MRAEAPESVVVAAVDESPAAVAVARCAATLAQALGARLALAHVTDTSAARTPRATSSAALQDPAGELRRMRESQARALLAEVAWRAGCEEADAEVLFGEPGTALRERAAAPDVLMLVTGSRGRGPLRAAVLGTVSGELAANAPVPVVVVPAAVAEAAATAA
ncbi:MAG TPA: universal stress protein [Miltoncostaeaceae bacterium]|nr:universal stress protein [Miltoncostaeaceae bacterium]